MGGTHCSKMEMKGKKLSYLLASKQHPAALGSGIGTSSVCCLSFSFSNNVKSLRANILSQIVVLFSLHKDCLVKKRENQKVLHIILLKSTYLALLNPSLKLGKSQKVHMFVFDLSLLIRKSTFCQKVTVHKDGKFSS